MEITVIVVFIIFSVLMSIIQANNHKQKIAEKIYSIGGEVKSIERKKFSMGPFLGFKRGRTIYRIEYLKDSEIKECWVKFGDLFGPDWRL